MTVEYSEDFKRQIDAEIIRLNGEKSRIEDTIAGLQVLLAARKTQDVVKPGRRGVRPKKVDSSVDLDQQHIKRGRKGMPLQALLAIDTSAMNPQELKKHKDRIYAHRWRAAKAAGGLKNGGMIVKPPKNGKANKFDLGRDFDLEEKDCRLMMSYIISWKGMGRLETIELNALSNIEGIPVGRLSPAERGCLREVFYSVRKRVMSKTSTEAKIEG